MSLYRIILADDEEEVRKGIIRKIDWQRLGFEVVGDAENGEDALEKIEQLEPDVVMTDIRMPYMDGLTLTAKIRQKYPSVKVLIFSGFDDFEYAQQAIKLNVTEYILKPVNVEELSEILNRVRENLDEELSLIHISPGAFYTGGAGAVCCPGGTAGGPAGAVPGCGRYMQAGGGSFAGCRTGKGGESRRTP